MASHDDFTCKIKIRADERDLVRIEAFSYREDAINILLGESGIGKTLISKALYGLLDPQELYAEINGEAYSEYLHSERTQTLRRNSFFVFQEPSSHLNPLLKLRDQLREGSIQEVTKEKEILEFLWDRQDLSDTRHILEVYPKPYRPSGGEKQRILIAMAFKKIIQFFKHGTQASTNLFVFDEPSGNLDNHFRNIVLDQLFRFYRKRHFTILFITHDYSMISRIVDQYKDMQSHILFRELYLVGTDRCEMREFSTERYLQWVNEQRKQPDKKSRRPETTVLSLNGQFGVFGRSFQIFRENEPSDCIIKKGEMVYLKAPSGGGKTTLAKIITGLIPADKVRGSISGFDFDQHTSQKDWVRHAWGRKVGMAFQHADEALNQEASVQQIFQGLPLKEKPTTVWLKQQLGQLFEFRIDEIFLNKKVKYLSGGQKQRLNLLRSLSLNVDLLILDEPLNGLDFDSTRKVIDLLREKTEQGLSVLMISHNEEIFDAIIEPRHIYYLRQITTSAQR
jgi:peptide/nickel transport system ATP-binding protein